MNWPLTSPGGEGGWLAGQLGPLSVCRVFDYKPDFRLAGQWKGDHLLKGNGMNIFHTVCHHYMKFLCRDPFLENIFSLQNEDADNGCVRSIPRFYYRENSVYQRIIALCTSGALPASMNYAGCQLIIICMMGWKG